MGIHELEHLFKLGASQRSRFTSMMVFTLVYMYIEWASRVIAAVWDFSKMIWDGGYKQIHDTNPTTNKITKTTELLHILDTEILTLRQTRLDYDSQQLLLNIDSKKSKAKNHTIYKWLKMLRHRREAALQRKQHDESNRIRARPITLWYKRSSGT